MRNIMQNQDQETINRLNEVTNKNVIMLAEQTHRLDNNTNKDTNKEALVSSGKSKSPELNEVEAVDSEADED